MLYSKNIQLAFEPSTKLITLIEFHYSKNNLQEQITCSYTSSSNTLTKRINLLISDQHSLIDCIELVLKYLTPIVDKKDIVEIQTELYKVLDL